MKHAISSSIYPYGVICTREKLRTIKVERIYEQTFEICSNIKSSTPIRIRTGDSLAENQLS